jgi:putative membrane protein
MTIRSEPLRLARTAGTFDVQRFLPSFVLAGYGIFILSLFARHVMSLYINPVYIGPTTLAGAVLVGLAAIRLPFKNSGECSKDGCCGVDGCSCSESRPRIWTYALLAVPLFLALVFPPRSLAVFSANQRGTQLAGMSVMHGSTAVRRVSLSVDTRSFAMGDWVGALSADPNPADYKGKPVQVSGIVMHNPGSVPTGYITVIRYLVTCCVADARPVGLIVKDTSNGALKDNQWVEVTGTMSAAPLGGQKVAVVSTKKLTPIKSSNPYMY